MRKFIITEDQAQVVLEALAKLPGKDCFTAMAIIVQQIVPIGEDGPALPPTPPTPVTTPTDSSAVPQQSKPAPKKNHKK